MNKDQINGMLRIAVPAAVAYASARWPQYIGLMGDVLAGISVFGSAGMSAVAHTDNGKIAAVEAIPDVQKIVVKSTADMQPAIADPERPKVVAQ